MSFITNTIKVSMMVNCCLQTQTSLVYEIETDNVYEDFYWDKNLFNFSDYPTRFKVFWSC